MTKEEARQFRENWAIVNQLMIEEARRKTPEERFRDLAIMYRAGKIMGWDQRPADDEEIVRARWQKLREKLGGKRSHD